MKTIDTYYSEVIDFLRTHIAPYYYYHGYEHTKYVFDQVNHIAAEEGVSGHDLFLVQLGALYHDTGFIEGMKNHEDRSCIIAQEELAHRGFSKKEIKIIQHIILATRIPQSPKTHLECILADADLQYLGTDLFEPVSLLLYKELLHFNPEMSEHEWNELQIAFIEKHSYHTTYCKNQYEATKQLNLNSLKKRR